MFSQITDLLIVGGGLIGLSLADEALRKGLTVAILEKERLGARAAWAGAGMLNCRPWPRRQNPDYHDLILTSAKLHPLWAERLKEETDLDVGYRRCGSLELILEERATPAGMENLERLAQGCREREVRVERLAREEVQALEPRLDLGGVVAALHFPDDAQVRPPRLVKALALACRQRGATALEGVEAAAVWLEGGAARGVVARDGARYAGGRTVFCTGAWTGQFPELARAAPRLGKIEPVRGQIVAFQADPALCRRVVTQEHHYLVPRPDGLLLAGSTMERVGFTAVTTPEGQAGLCAFAGRLLPALKGARPFQSWADLRPGLKGPHPLLGPVPGIQDLWVAAGHFRNGIILAPLTAQSLVALLGDERPPVPLEPWLPRAHETRNKRARQSLDEEEE